MELYIKAGPENGQVGDCPFAHYVRCVLDFKQLEHKVLPCKQDSKPDWLVSEMGGKMPCLKKGDFTMVESGAIVDHLESTHPEPKLMVDGMEEAVQLQSSLFPAIAKFIKSKEFQADLEQGLLDQAQKLDDHLKSKGSKYLAGNQISLVDFNLAPKLFHMDTTLAHFHPETHEKLKEMTALKAYMETMFNEESFKNTLYPTETVIWGWSAARG